MSSQEVDVLKILLQKTEDKIHRYNNIIQTQQELINSQINEKIELQQKINKIELSYNVLKDEYNILLEKYNIITRSRF
jgi:hypothetical protein